MSITHTPKDITLPLKAGVGIACEPNPAATLLVNPLESRDNYNATSNNMQSLLTVRNVTARPSTASVPITVLLYSRPLLCSFNVGILLLLVCVSLTIIGQPRNSVFIHRV